jgi:GST-like protein
MIDVYYWPTPNGKKVTIFLEEAAAPYRVIPLDIGRGDQLDQSYLKLNPNHRMPAIVDHDPGDDGGPLAVFESAAILFYLAEKTGKFWSQDIRAKYQVAQWVIWQAANQGPKIGEYGHFHWMGARHGDQSYAQRRFSDEVNRIYGVMNYQLYSHPYLGGNEFSIADIICYPYAAAWKWQGQDLDEFPHVKRWLREVGDRPGVQRGMAVAQELSFDPEKTLPEELERRAKILFNQRAIPAPTRQP